MTVAQDADGLIGIHTPAQLDAVRHDLDGDGAPTTAGAAGHAAVFEVTGGGTLSCAVAGGRRGYELRADVAERRGRVDIALAHLLSDAGLRRSEAAALPWADIARAADGSGRVTVRRSKTDQAGQGAILYVTAATMTALAAIRQGAPDAAPVFGLSAGQIGRRGGAGHLRRELRAAAIGPARRPAERRPGRTPPAAPRVNS